jgi:hypothetical protein
MRPRWGKSGASSRTDGALIPELLSLPLGCPIWGGPARRSPVKVMWVHAIQIGQSHSQ